MRGINQCKYRMKRRENCSWFELARCSNFWVQVIKILLQSFCKQQNNIIYYVQTLGKVLKENIFKGGSLKFLWRSGGLVVSALDFRSGGRWFEPGLCRRVVSLDKKLCSTLSLFTQVYKWVPAIIMLGDNLAMD